MSGKPVGAPSLRLHGGSPLRPSYVRGRALRRVATSVVGALLLAGLGAGIANRRHSLSDAWNAIRRHTFSDALVAVQRHASDAWIAIRSHMPFDAPEAGSATASGTPSRASVRDATASRAKHRRAQPSVGAGKAKSAANRNTDDLSSTP